MFLFYIDESGTLLKDNQTNYFILATIAMSDKYSSQNQEKFLLLKRSIVKAQEPELWELKGSELCQGKGKTFTRYKLEARVRIYLEIAETLNETPCHIFGVIANKKLLFDNREGMKSDINLYGCTFYRLLEELDSFLKSYNESGIILMDSRSTLHTAVQDGRLLTTYREWVKLQEDNCNFVEEPWFGESKSYVGLQLADYVAYLINLKTQNIGENDNKFKFLEAFDILQSKIHLVEIPKV
jgi:hypothetical protein